MIRSPNLHKDPLFRDQAPRGLDGLPRPDVVRGRPDLVSRYRRAYESAKTAATRRANERLKKRMPSGGRTYWGPGTTKTRVWEQDEFDGILLEELEKRRGQLEWILAKIRRAPWEK